MTVQSDEKTLIHMETTQALSAERTETSELYVPAIEICMKVNPSAVMVFRLKRVHQFFLVDLMAVK